MIVKERRLSWIARHKGLFFLLVPLSLSSFTHLYNLVGFPWIHEDEGHYLRRAMSVLLGFGPQETLSDFDHPYDHPYFGQLFLASLLDIIDYPHTQGSSLSSDEGQSIAMLYLIPRLLTGILAISDTFLVYKIAEHRYSIRVALIASVLFAVMPLSWLSRGVLLDNILLPFLLLSVLFALYTRGRVGEKPHHINNSHTQGLSRRVILVLLSGIFLGIAIYTKIPACTMVPLVAFIIYKYVKDLRLLAIWFIPVVLIAVLWPVYSIISGQLDGWVEGALWQVTQRPEKALSGAFIGLVHIDPVLTTLGLAGLVYTGIHEVRRRDYFIILWIIPYLIFLYLIGWVSYFHWIILIPGLAISAAILIKGVLSKTIDGSRKHVRLISYNTTIITIAIGFFGLLSTTMLIRTDATSSYFELYSFIVQQLTENEQSKESFDGKPDITIIGHRWTWAFTWIPRYVLDDRISFVHFNSSERVETERFLLLVDIYVKRHLNDKDSEGIKMVKTLYDNSQVIKTFEDKTIIPYDKHTYPYTSMSENRGIGRYTPVEIRTNTK